MSRQLFFLLSMLLVTSCFVALPQSYNKGTITSHGTAEIEATPDIATVSFTVREESKDAKTAQKLMAEKADKAVKAIKEKGIEEKDIKTTGYNSYPKYNYLPPVCTKNNCTPSKPELIGYEATESFTLKIREIAKAQEIVTALAGLEVGEVGGLNFEIEDMTKFKAQAKTAAIKKAKEDGKVIADALGVRLGKVVAFSEDQPTLFYARGSSMKMSAAVMEAAVDTAIVPPIQAGEQKITSTVAITYKIK